MNPPRSRCLPPRKSGPTAAAQVRAYFAAQPAATRRVLKQMRDAIRAAAPRAEEAFSYGIPGFRVEQPLSGTRLKSHVSLYPIGRDRARTGSAAKDTDVERHVVPARSPPGGAVTAW